MDMEYKVVVTRYNERLWWLSQIPQECVVVYDKSDVPNEKYIAVPNVGRDGETHFRYIVDNYDTLPDYVVFLQGNPYDHFSMVPLNMERAVQDEMQRGYTTGMPFLRNPWDVGALYQFPELRVEYFYKLFFDGECPWDTWSVGPKFIEFSSGMQYIVPKQCILARPLEFYKRLHKMMHDGELDGKTVEWLLKYVYDPSVPTHTLP